MSKRTLGDFLDIHLEPRTSLCPAKYGKILDKYSHHPITSNVLVGIEIECENAATTKRPTEKTTEFLELHNHLWTIKEDGSLRNHGLEWVTPRGFTAAQAATALQYLSDAFAQFYTNITANARTGVHIHLDFLRKTQRELGSFILLYCLLEKSLFKYSGGRSRNIFCVPVRESTNHVGAVLRSILKHPNNWQNIYRLFRVSAKYSAFNLLALSHYGTIEFRHGHGTNRPHTIIPWLEVLIKMYEYAEKQEFEAFLERIRLLNTTSEYEAIARDALPADFFRRVDMGFITRDMAKGCAFIKECMIDPAEVSTTVVTPQPAAPDGLADEFDDAPPRRGLIRPGVNVFAQQDEEVRFVLNDEGNVVVEGPRGEPVPDAQDRLARAVELLRVQRVQFDVAENQPRREARRGPFGPRPARPVRPR